MTAPVAAGVGPRADVRRWGTLSRCAAWLVPVLSLLALFPLLSPLPTWDQWSMAEVWAAHFEGKPVLPLLLAPYNGHRNVVPRLFFYGLGRVSDWNVRLEVVASYLAACITLALLLRMSARLGNHGRLLALPIAAHAFSLLQYENFMSGYPFGQNLSQLLVTTVIFLLTRPALGTGAFAGAAVAATVATFSWGAGLAAFPVGLAALLLRGERRPARWVVWLVLTAAAAAAVRQSAAGAFRPVPWPRLPAFFLTLLGKAWSPFAVPSPRLTVALGAVALLVFAVVATWAYLRLRERSLPWVVLGCYSLIAAGLISLGRTGDGIAQAFASHYVTTTYPLAIACLVLLTMLILELRPAVTTVRRLPWIAAAVVAIGFTLQPALASWQSFVMVRGWQPIVRRNALAIARGTATDAQIRESEHPVPELVRSSTELMRAHRLAWFRQLIDGETPIGTVDRLAGQGGAAGSFAVEAGQPWTIEGWAVRSRHEGGPVRAVELFVDGRKVAAAILDLPRDDVADYYHSAGFRDSGWTMSLAAGTVPAGDHRLSVAAVDFAGGRHPLLEGDVQVAAAAVEPARAAALRTLPPSHTLAAGGRTIHP